MGVAFLIGGNGQIGRATAQALAQDSWEVIVASRSGSLPPELERAGVRSVRLDRADSPAVRKALGDGVDVVIDVIPYTREDAEQLLALDGLTGSLIAISSASVYADRVGHTLTEATSLETFPELPVPIPESQRTAVPADETYSTRKVAMERTILG